MRRCSWICEIRGRQRGDISDCLSQICKIIIINSIFIGQLVPQVDLYFLLHSFTYYWIIHYLYGSQYHSLNVIDRIGWCIINTLQHALFCDHSSLLMFPYFHHGMHRMVRIILYGSSQLTNHIRLPPVHILDCHVKTWLHTGGCNALWFYFSA